MKYHLKELLKALDLAGKGGLSDVIIEIDPRERLVVKFVDPNGGDEVAITVFNTEVNKMATITRTTRL